jgi:hypothetical protein
MRRYSRTDEERIHALRRVREWADSGLLDPGQRARLEGDLHVDLRRTNPFLRSVLALFTALIVATSIALTINVLGIARDLPFAITTAIAALVCIGLAEHLVDAFRLYRFGVEEALAVMAVVLVAGSAAALTSWL